MNAPARPVDPPMAEPGGRPTDDDDDGAEAGPGSAPGASARTDRPGSDDRATMPRGGKRRSGTGATDAEAGRDAEGDDDEWRHEPVAPVDEPNPLRSLGKAVGETVTGSDADTTPRKR